jgi:hypothetical protein
MKPWFRIFFKIQNEITTSSWFLKSFKELAVGPVTCQTNSYILGPLFWERPHHGDFFFITLDMISAKKN